MWLRGLYRNEPIFEPEDFKEAAVCAGMSENEIENTLKIHTEPEVKHRLRQTTDEADALNAVGIPTIVVQGFDGKKHAIWGSDRMGIVGFLIGEKYHGPLTEMSKY